MAGTMQEVNDETFAELVEGAEGAVLVDFWAEWCGPCKMLAPILDEVAAERPHLKVVKLDTDANPGITVKYDVMSLPTVILFKNGDPVMRLVGASPKGKLLDRLQEFV